MDVLMIIAPKKFRDEELFHTRNELEDEGHDVTVASKTTDPVVGMLGNKAEPDIKLEDVNEDDYDAVTFVGGSGASVYFDDKRVKEIAKNFWGAGKVVSAICIAPSILANAGVLEGKKATSWPSEKDNINEKSAGYTGEGVTVDGRLITAKGPEYAKEFGQKLAGMLSEE